MHAKHIARITHEVNRAYCESIGDNSQPSWEEAPDWQKKSAIAGVEFLQNTPLATPEMSHQSWLDVKEADGWVYGETKDPEKKTHPCIVPYGDLPKEQQAKDALFHAIVRAASVAD